MGCILSPANHFSAPTNRFEPWSDFPCCTVLPDDREITSPKATWMNPGDLVDESEQRTAL